MFFYMNDIVFVFLVKRLQMVEVIIAILKKRYNLTSNGYL